jgi:RHS repeat-associated protein
MLDTATVDPKNRAGGFNPGDGAISARPGHANACASLGIRPWGLKIAPRKTLYEQYHPYGTSAYRAQDGTLGVSAKRYRYNGKERDDETKLYYYGARYYAPWLGRWTAADPLAFADGVGAYTYVRGSPVVLSDPNGMESRFLGVSQDEKFKADIQRRTGGNARWLPSGEHGAGWYVNVGKGGYEAGAGRTWLDRTREAKAQSAERAERRAYLEGSHPLTGMATVDAWAAEEAAIERGMAFEASWMETLAQDAGFTLNPLERGPLFEDDTPYESRLPDVVPPAHKIVANFITTSIGAIPALVVAASGPDAPSLGESIEGLRVFKYADEEQELGVAWEGVIGLAALVVTAGEAALVEGTVVAGTTAARTGTVGAMASDAVPIIPRRAVDTLGHVRRTGQAPQGQVGGRLFRNDGRGGGRILPQQTREGAPISYHEFDIHPHTPGVNRGAERIVVGSDGRAWYTSDHYMSFLQM